MRFCKKFIVSLSLCAGMAAAWGQAAGPMTEAATLGNGKGLQIYNDIKTNPITNTTVPGYNGATQTQQGLFQEGKGELTGPGVTRSAGCLNQGDPECDAVNLIQWGPNNRPRPTFNAADPLISGARDRLKNPNATVGSFATPAGSTAGALSQNSTVCSPTVTPKPAVYQDQTCHDDVQFVDQICNSNRQFALDPITTYRCLKVNQELAVNTCSQTQEVVIDAKQTYECLNNLASESVQHCGESRQVDVAWNYQYQCVDDHGSQTVDNCNVDRFVQLDPKTVYQCLEQQKTQSTTSGAVDRVVTVKADYDYLCQKGTQSKTALSCNKTSVVTVVWATQTSMCSTSGGQPFKFMNPMPGFIPDPRFQPDGNGYLSCDQYGVRYPHPVVIGGYVNLFNGTPVFGGVDITNFYDPGGFGQSYGYPSRDVICSNLDFGGNLLNCSIANNIGDDGTGALYIIGCNATECRYYHGPWPADLTTFNGVLPPSSVSIYDNSTGAFEYLSATWASQNFFGTTNQITGLPINGTTGILVKNTAYWPGASVPTVTEVINNGCAQLEARQ